MVSVPVPMPVGLFLVVNVVAAQTSLFLFSKHKASEEMTVAAVGKKFRRIEAVVSRRWKRDLYLCLCLYLSK
jgi:hypothetical protein